MISISSPVLSMLCYWRVFVMLKQHFVFYVLSYCCCFLLYCSMVTECSLLPSGNIDNDCSEFRFLYEESSGRISSPNFPYSYPPNKTCAWNINARSFERIVLSFPIFQVNGFPDIHEYGCMHDYVEVYDMNHETSQNKLVGKFCRVNLPPAHYITTGHEARIVLHSSRDPGFGKFEILYSKLSCEENFTAVQGSFSSPNYPKPYPSDKMCTWLIAVPKDLVIVLRFSSFDLEPTSVCSTDYVEVLDGESKDSLQIGRYCASDRPPSSIRSTENKLRITFKSFTHTIHSGFHAVYKTEQHCGGALNQESGSFTSPGYGIISNHDISANRVCIWIISVEKGSIVSLSFREFDIPSNGNGTQCADNNFVIVYDGVSKSNLIGKFCNKAKPHNFVRSSGHIMRIEFRTDRNFFGRGFYATYTTVDPHDLYDKCTRLGKTHNLLFPCQNGMNYIDCDWRCDGTDDCGDGSDELYCLCDDSSCGKDKSKSNAEPYVITILATMVTAVLLCVTVFVIERIWRKRRRRSRRSRRRTHHLTRGTPPHISTLESLSPPPPYSADHNDGEDSFSFDSTCALPPSYAAEETSEVEETASVQLSETTICTSIPENSDSNSITEHSNSYQEDTIIQQGSVSFYQGTACDTELQGDGDSVSISSNENQPLIV